MTEQELRAMIRESIARHLGPETATPALSGGTSSAASYAGHASFARLPLTSGGDGDGLCIIEPAVRCTHCGYCQSFGH